MRFAAKDPHRVRTGFALFGETLSDGTFILWERFHFRHGRRRYNGNMVGGGYVKSWAWGTEEPTGPTGPPPPKK